MQRLRSNPHLEHRADGGYRNPDALSEALRTIMQSISRAKMQGGQMHDIDGIETLINNVKQHEPSFAPTLSQIMQFIDAGQLDKANESTRTLIQKVKDAT